MRARRSSQEALGRHHELDLHRHRASGGLARHALDEGVGHDLPSAAAIALGNELFGAAVERRERSHALRDGQEAGEQGHGVRSRAHADPAVGLSAADPPHHGLRVQLVRQGPGRPRHGRVAHRGQMATHPRVDGPAVGGAQDCGLAAHHCGPPLADPPSGEVLERVGHLVHQGPGQAEVARAAGRGVAAGECDLGGDAPAALARRHPTGRLLFALRGVEGDCHAGLRSGGSALERLQQADLLNALRVGDIRVEVAQPVDQRAEGSGGQPALATAAPTPQIEHVSTLGGGCDSPLTCENGSDHPRRARPPVGSCLTLP